jgi:hypothetical protein
MKELLGAAQQKNKTPQIGVLNNHARTLRRMRIHYDSRGLVEVLAAMGSMIVLLPHPQCYSEAGFFRGLLDCAAETADDLGA